MAETRLTTTRSIFGFFVLYAVITCTYAADTLPANHTIRYNETIVSPQETFELGFFSPGNSMNHYVGIWYKKRAFGTVVWVANRDAPLTHTSGELTLTLQGVLSLRDATTGDVVWSSAKSSSTSVSNPIGQLLDTGNFIIYEEGDDINQENPTWQSFDFLTDTMLPGMKLGRNLVTGFETRFTSWKADNDPASGEFLYSIDTHGYPQLVLTEGAEIIKFRGGPWNGLGFTGNPYMRPNPFYKFTFVLNESEVYFNYNLRDINVLMRMVLQPSGRVEILLLIDSKQDWIVYSGQPIDQCDQYAVCGPFGRCNNDSSPVCECLKRFEPKSPDRWRYADWSQGCGHNFMYCGPGEEFMKYSNLKLPDTRWSLYDQNMTLEECENMCKSNCSCSAYTQSNILGPGSGCLRWFGDLIDIRTFAEDGDTIYIRVPPSDLDSIVNRNSSRGSSNVGIRLRVIVPIAFVVSIILLSICLFYRFKGKKQHQQGTPKNVFERDQENRSDDEDIELPLFGLCTLLKATDNFSTNNKLGEGGYGPVYKKLLAFMDVADFRLGILGDGGGGGITVVNPPVELVMTTGEPVSMAEKAMVIFSGVVGLARFRSLGFNQICAD